MEMKIPSGAGTTHIDYCENTVSLNIFSYKGENIPPPSIPDHLVPPELTAYEKMIGETPPDTRNTMVAPSKTSNIIVPSDTTKLLVPRENLMLTLLMLLCPHIGPIGIEPHSGRGSSPRLMIFLRF